MAKAIVRTNSRLIEVILAFSIQTGAKHSIPKFITNAKSVCWILVVMQHVVLFQFQQNGMLKSEMMQGIVANIVTQVTHHETRKKCGDQHWT